MKIFPTGYLPYHDTPICGPRDNNSAITVNGYFDHTGTMLNQNLKTQKKYFAGLNKLMINFLQEIIVRRKERDKKPFNYKSIFPLFLDQYGTDYTCVSLPDVKSQTLQDLSSEPVTRYWSLTSQQRHVIFSEWHIPVTNVPELVFQTRALKQSAESSYYFMLERDKYFMDWMRKWRQHYLIVPIISPCCYK